MKRIFTLFLFLFCLTVWAQSQELVITGTDDGWNRNGDRITITKAGSYEVTSNGVKANDYIRFQEDLTGDVQITLKNVNYYGYNESFIKCGNSANITLTLEGENRLKTTHIDRSPINKTDGDNTLTINGDGKISITAGNNAACVGGDHKQSTANITITGGYLVLDGSSTAPHIGGGNGYNPDGSYHYTASAKNIRVIGGTIIGSIGISQFGNNNTADIIITGGSVKGLSQCSEKNGRNSILIENLTANVKITEWENLSGDYGIDNIYSDDEGKVYLWLPQGTTPTPSPKTFAYKVTYASEYGNPVTTYENEITPNNLQQLEEKGYTFNGWSTTEGGNAITVTYTISGATSLYALWTKNELKKTSEVSTLSGTYGTALTEYDLQRLLANDSYGTDGTTKFAFKGTTTYGLSIEGGKIKGKPNEVIENGTLTVTASHDDCLEALEIKIPVSIGKATPAFGRFSFETYTYGKEFIISAPALTGVNGETIGEGITVTYHQGKGIDQGGWVDSPNGFPAGEHSVKAAFAGNGNYEEVEMQATFTIGKATLSPSIPTGLQAEKGQKLSAVKLPSDPSGTWTWDAPETVLGETGEHSYPASFTPTDANYDVFKTELTVKVVYTPPYIPSYYDLRFEANDSVLFTAKKTNVIEGSSFTFTAEAAEGYDPATLTVEYKRGRNGSWKTLEPRADGTYRIASVYNNIYVRASVSRLEDPTAVEKVDGETRVKAVGHTLYIYTSNKETVSIFTLTGTLFKQQRTAGSTEIRLPAGMYLIRVDGRTYKVVIR